MGNATLFDRRQQIVVDDPLYTSYDFSGDSADEELAKFIFAKGHLDAYCLGCGKPSVYMVDHGYSYSDKAKALPKKGVVTVEAKCTRHESNLFKVNGQIYASFFRNWSVITKIGQYPSRADLDFGSINPVFNKELDPSLRSELGSAVGLRAHGIGVGSFVYLRRIFESLVNEAHDQAREDEEWDESAFAQMRMPERIKVLREYLPSRLSRTAKLYSILSKGIHELSEEECLNHFDLVQRAIYMILSERHDEKLYDDLVAKVNNEAGNLSNPES